LQGVPATRGGAFTGLLSDDLITLLVPAILSSCPIDQGAGGFCFDDHDGIASKYWWCSLFGALTNLPFGIGIPSIEPVEIIPAVAKITAGAKNPNSG